jgi:hypothetical protein
VLAAIGIAVVSVLGAVVAYRGAQADNDAGTLDQNSVQERVRAAEIESSIRAEVNQDVRNLAEYQQEYGGYLLLGEEARQEAGRSPSLAASLEAEARADQEAATARLRGFIVRLPSLTQAAGCATGSPPPSFDCLSLSYDEAQAITVRERETPILSELKPDATLAAARDKHSETILLLGVVTLFISCLVFLTLAEFVRYAVARVFASAAGVIALGSVVVWVVIERHYG